MTRRLSATLSPDRTVRDEIRLLRQLGFRYAGTYGGHHRFEHPVHGALRPMSSTPRNATGWRRRHRAQVASLMGLTLWQLERLIAGQSLKRTGPRRKRPGRPEGKRRSPVSLLTAAGSVDGAAVVSRADGSADQVRLVPMSQAGCVPPGSATARARGCSCPADANNHGRGRDYVRADGTVRVGVVVSHDCPVHALAVVREVAA